MTGWREASKPNAFSRLRPSIIDPTGLTNLGEVIVDLIDVVAFDGNRLIVRGHGASAALPTSEAAPAPSPYRASSQCLKSSRTLQSHDRMFQRVKRGEIKSQPRDRQSASGGGATRCQAMAARACSIAERRLNFVFN
jgi:hypothetical protein